MKKERFSRSFFCARKNGSGVASSANVTPQPSFRYNSRLFFGGQSACNLLSVDP